MAAELQTDINFAVSVRLRGGAGILNYMSEIKTIGLLDK